MTKKRDVSSIVLHKASIDIKLDLRELIEQAVYDKFPEAAEVTDITIDADRMLDGCFRADDFWISVDVEVQE